ncbi:MAG TPA: hypothetical protein PKK53_10485, partial [Hydrogenophilus thermoluteolus]|nr:hypothetical protein [Hydrogenophilus thermoluteolus]
MKLAAVDLGSNTFRLTIAAVDGELVFPRDEYKVPVRLAAGLTAEKWNFVFVTRKDKLPVH